MSDQLPPLPSCVDWQLTFACQLRCTHCYTESGRRPARKLGRSELLRIADKLVTMRLDSVILVGGEPLLVPELFEIIERLQAGGIAVTCFTNGVDVSEAKLRELVRFETPISVSIDGATAEVNDRIRGRQGAFDATMRTLRLLDRIAAERRERGLSRVWYGLEMVLVRSNFAQARQLCVEIAPQLSELAFLAFGAVIPIGLASEARFNHELLTEDELQELMSPAFRDELRRLAPAAVPHLSITDNRGLQVHTNHGERATAYRGVMEIEPSGDVRGFAACEGTIGNILHEDPATLWRRCLDRVFHPFVVERLSKIQSSIEWAAAIRAIDREFGAPEALVRLRRRGEQRA